MLIRQNLKLLLVAWFEAAQGAPSAGWSPAGGAAAPSSAGAQVPLETEAVAVRLAVAL